MPYFSRSQLGVILLLGAGLIFLWAWRAHFFLAPAPAPSRNLNLHFVEVAGAVPRPGVYSFDHPPTLPEVLRQAGGPAAAPPGGAPLASGSRVEVGASGKYQVTRMAGRRLLTLGLPIDLNTASAEDLDALPGVGPALAQRIVDYRTAHGPFPNIAALENVSGIGPNNLEKLKPYLMVESPPAPALPEQRAAMSPAKPAARPQPGKRSGPKPKPELRSIDPNRATQKDLETLPGIGPALAKRILDYRATHGPFKNVDDLQKVSGIGPKKLAKMRPYLTMSQKNGTADAR